MPDILVDSTLERKELKLPRGAYSKIARRIRVSPQAVRAVFLGIKKSARITAAIEKYKARVGIAA